jgi:hypothetical protein
MDAIDQLLSQIKADDKEPEKITNPQTKTPPIQPISDIDSLLAEVHADLAKPVTPKSLKNDSPVIDNILSQVKASYKEQDQERSPLALHSVQSLLNQQQLQAEQLKQIETLKLRAKAWLKQLDPLSTEGLWFERFAEGYPTKLAAAINYLQES